MAVHFGQFLLSDLLLTVPPRARPFLKVGGGHVPPVPYGVGALDYRSSRHCLRSSNSNKLVVPPVKLSTWDGMLLLYQAQFFGTASLNTSETQHYPLIRLGVISKLAFLLVINILATPWRSRNSVTACSIQIPIVIVIILYLNCIYQMNLYLNALSFVNVAYFILDSTNCRGYVDITLFTWQQVILLINELFIMATELQQRLLDLFAPNR